MWNLVWSQYIDVTKFLIMELNEMNYAPWRLKAAFQPECIRVYYILQPDS